MEKREFCMLAHTYKRGMKINKKPIVLSDYFMSEKYDGQRVIWDNTTKGVPCKDVSWANPNCHHQISTGLWSRYGLPIFYPDTFELPPYPCDGELLGRTLAQTISIVSRNVPDSKKWATLKYVVFDRVPISALATQGYIHNGVASYTVKWKDYGYHYSNVFSATYSVHKNDTGANWFWAPQYLIGKESDLNIFINGILARKGEGAVLRHKFSTWEPHRSWHLLKYKPVDQSDAVIIGFSDADEDKRLAGLVGGLIVKWEDKTFTIGSGLNDAERQPGYFKVGQKIAFRYTGFTETGIPREARLRRD